MGPHKESISSLGLGSILQKEALRASEYASRPAVAGHGDATAEAGEYEALIQEVGGMMYV